MVLLSLYIILTVFSPAAHSEANARRMAIIESRFGASGEVSHMMSHDVTWCYDIFLHELAKSCVLPMTSLSPWIRVCSCEGQPFLPQCSVNVH